MNRPRRHRPARRRTAEEIAARAAAAPKPAYDEALPVSAVRREIAEVIAAHQVVIVAGETGSGKTTQLPKICLDLGRGLAGQIGHTQPRRIAARTVAERIADELGVAVGEDVGYAVRFTDKVSADTYIKVMTDGILLAEIQRDRLLRRYDTIIIDEAHERSLNIDFLLGYLKRLLPDRPDLKVIITSATIDPEAFSRFFDGAPIIEVSGRTYPVQIRYRPLVDPDDPGTADRDLMDGLVDAVAELSAAGPGDILVFLSGEREIRDAADTLTGLGLRDTEVLPLYARLSAAEQHRVFAPHRGRRIVLATNVAETSLTVPGIRYVIDAGTARISRYSRTTKVQRLPIEPISQASARQRSGRCGRVAPGIAIRLYAEADFEARPAFTDPEILRTSLASVILQMLSARLGRIEEFEFIDPPDRRQIADGMALLRELGAVRAEHGGDTLTPTGRSIAALPIDPRLARMVVEGDRRGVSLPVMVIAAALSIQDPRERPVDKEAQADQSHVRFTDKTSDFLTLLNLWTYLRAQQKELSSNAFRRMCRREFINYLRVREWQDLVAQIRSIGGGIGIHASGGGIGIHAPDGGRAASRRDVKDSGPSGRASPGSDIKVSGQGGRASAGRDVGGLGSGADDDLLHQCLLTGLLSHIGAADPKDKRAYAGARGTRFAIFPGSALARRRPEFVMCGELVETSRLWGRTVAAIDPLWAEQAGAHEVRRSYSEPRWSRRRAAALATERVTLYGVTLVAGRTVNYARIDPELARELFIRQALVEGDWQTRHTFARRNAERIEAVASLEDKARRRDLLVDDEAIFAFYDARIPADITSGRAFDAWWKTERHRRPDLLDLTVTDLLSDADRPDGAAFPDVWSEGEHPLELRYRFEPASVPSSDEDADGVSIDIPLLALHEAEAEEFEWLVPGHRLDLVTALIRTLPKAVRRHVVPAGDRARQVLPELDPAEGPLRPQLADALRRVTGAAVRAEDFEVARLPEHLRMTFRVLGDDGAVLASGKDLSALQDALQGRQQDRLTEAAAALERTGLRGFEVDEVSRSVELDSGRGPVTGYPALVRAGDGLDLRVLTSSRQQAAAMRESVGWLVARDLPPVMNQVLRALDPTERLALTQAPHPSAAALYDDCLRGVCEAAVDRHGIPWSRAAYQRLLEQVRGSLVGELLSAMQRVAAVLQRRIEVDGELHVLAHPAFASARADVDDQLAFLLPPDFVSRHGVRRLPDIERHLRGLVVRLRRITANRDADARAIEQVRALRGEYDQLVEALPATEPVPASYTEVRWMVEELRLGLFAQSVAPAYKVSVQRVHKALDAL